MTKRLLLTSFEAYGGYGLNVSREVGICLREERWQRRLPDGDVELVTLRPLDGVDLREYPVEFDQIESRLRKDLTPDIGALILMGQAPGRTTIDLERFAINAGTEPGSNGDCWFPLEAGGPEAVRSDLPLDEWVQLLKEQGFPMKQSFHAGTYLCNASLYYALRNFQRRGLPGAAAFLHLPLATEFFPEQPVAMPMKTILKAVEATIALALEWIDDQERIEPSGTNSA
jgi:pyroglutamyl-peptidase